MKNKTGIPILHGFPLRDGLAFAVMLSGGFFMALIFTAVGPILSAMSSHFGGGNRGDIIAQLMQSMPNIGIILGGPLAGYLVERIGSRRLLLFSLAFYGLAGCVGRYFDDPYSLLGSRIIVGFAGAGIATATTALIAERLQGDRRVRALGYWSAVGAAGGAISVILSGSMADQGNWRTPFVLYGSAFILLGLAMVSLRPSPEKTLQPDTKSPGGALSRYWAIYLVIVGYNVIVFMTGVQISFLLAANGIHSPGTQSWIISGASIGAMCGAATYGFVQQYIGNQRSIILALALMAAGNWIMGSQESPILLALGCALNGWGGIMGNPYFSALLLDKVPVNLRGRALGLMYTMIFAGEFLNPFVVMPLRMVLGIHAAFMLVGVFAAAAALYVALKNRRAALDREELQ